MSEEYNVVQLGRMIAAIDAYEKSPRGFSRLVNDLDALLSSMRPISVDWDQKVRSTWGKLEEINADLVYREASFISQDELTEIAGVLQEFKDVIASYRVP